MVNIGQELKDARSKLGYSIKEASEATKVRAEYLAKLEDNSYEIPLHGVYIRGFLRLYSKFLKLDPDRITEAYNRLQTKDGRPGGPVEERESFGQFTLDYGSQSASKDRDTGEMGTGNQAAFDESVEENSYSLKGPLMAGAALLVILVGVALLKVFVFGGGPSGEVFADGEPGPSAAMSVEGSNVRRSEAVARVSPLDADLVTVVALAPAYVYVTDKEGTELFSGNLEMGERKDFSAPGDLFVASDQVQNIRIEQGGFPVDLKGATGRARLLVEHKTR